MTFASDCKLWWAVSSSNISRFTQNRQHGLSLPAPELPQLTDVLPRWRLRQWTPHCFGGLWPRDPFPPGLPYSSDDTAVRSPVWWSARGNSDHRSGRTGAAVLQLPPCWNGVGTATARPALPRTQHGLPSRVRRPLRTALTITDLPHVLAVLDTVDHLQKDFFLLLNGSSGVSQSFHPV